VVLATVGGLMKKNSFTIEDLFSHRINNPYKQKLQEEKEITIDGECIEVKLRKEVENEISETN
jgi:hypothetical protein